MAKAKRWKFSVDPSWSARQIAQEARQSAKHKYRDHPEIVELCDIAAGAAHTGLLPLLNPEERSTLHDSPVVVAPTAEFNAWTATAPSGDGNYIVFDLCIVTELAEFFSSVPGSEQRYAAWAACVLTGARRKTTGPLTNLAVWAEGPARELSTHMETADALRKLPQGRKETEILYFASLLLGLENAISFTVGHEYGHHALEHFRDERIAPNNQSPRLMSSARETNHAKEFAADAWSMYVISRLPAFELSVWMISIEMMFLYMHLVESFNESCRIIQGIHSPPSDHPPVIERSEKVSRLGEHVFSAELDDAGNLPEELLKNLQSRATIFGSMRKFESVYLQYLAECYCNDPDRTVNIHEAVRAGEIDMAAYEAEMKAIASKHRLDSPVSVSKRRLRRIRSKLF